MKKRVLISTVKEVIDDCKMLCKVLWFVFKIMGMFFATMLAVAVVFALVLIAVILLIVAIPYVVREGSVLMQQYGDIIQRLLVVLMIGYVVKTLFLYIRSVYRNNLNKIMKEESDEENKILHKD